MDEAEEVVQGVFFKVWERRGQLEVTVSLKAYLYRAVHNASLNHLKHQKVRQEYANHVKAMEEEGMEDPGMELTELQRDVTYAIEELPEKCREVFKLNRFEGLKYREVADLLGISEKTVENQMGKALKLLRDRLSHYLRVILPWLLFFNIP